ncbi:tryptophan halogenase [Steroidobacter agaridevorans]|uniref:Tryptophan halogenase n=1 Tax=Steroidobacter agaridevorans TaxID=2695856 RepID=A0A829YJ49_9GAMM|nr:tryptophan halogenase family protein [Steroidobacter agaridevorans]GFE82891.1 tryptophan halogenase [Steroidobacter agaridevorans]
MTRALQIVIVGGGSAGWMSAAAFARALHPQRYRITLIESDEIGTVGVGEATLPHIKAFNDQLGIDEAQFMRETRATFKLGIEFRNWGQPGDRYIHPFGVFGEPWGGVDFQHHWLRARQLGGAVAPFQEYSYAIAACRRNAFEFPTADRKSIRSTHAYAYHFDAGLYADFLRRWAIERGVRRVEGQVRDVVLDASGAIESLAMQSGARIEGDFFIDCTGFRSLLLGSKLGVQWEDWSAWLPCDRALAVPCERAGEFTPYTRSTAQTGGWIWRIPLQHRTGNGYVFSSRFVSEEQARLTLLNQLDGAALGEPRLLRFRPGRRVQAWKRNCVAVGLASGFLEPLESTSIFLIQAAVSDLSMLMPTPEQGRAVDPRLADEFNRLSDIQYARVRDFLILHYCANRRRGEALWDYVREMPLPETLVHKVGLFEARGHVPYYKDGLFSRDSWLAVLFGQGMMPRAYDRLADNVSVEQLERRMRELHERIASNAAAMPSHADFVARYCAEAQIRSVPGECVDAMNIKAANAVANEARLTRANAVAS